MGRVSELAARLHEEDVRRFNDLLSLERPSAAERIEADDLAKRLQPRRCSAAARQDGGHQVNSPARHAAPNATERTPS